ncbi:IS1 family transposase [Taibaiella lutea]|uniref:IS1 family transposase n=1 Tax=Taibaiella lutea TaxID=2608001 RepID=A0A5M6CQF6_9BACT|nr:IS1 family transposase [Taibaiella lutea]
MRYGVEQKCVHCQSTYIIKSGKTPDKKQRFLCKSCNKRFLGTYFYIACQPDINQQIIIGIGLGGGFWIGGQKSIYSSSHSNR